MSVERRFSLIRHEHTLQDLKDWGVVADTANWWGVIPSVGTDGVMEIGKYIDFHESDDDTDDFDYRIQSIGSRLYLSGDVQGGRSLWAGATNALPALGYANASTSLVLGYSGDFAYGLLAGVIGSGNAWIQAARFDGWGVAYNLMLQPLGGGVEITNGAYLVGGVVQSNWNEGAISGDNCLTFMRASAGGTNTPEHYDNANAQITYSYHGGGYARQFGFTDTNYGLYTRIQSANTWNAWKRIAMYSGATGHLDVNTYDTWSTSGWGRGLRIWTGAGSAALQFYDNTGLHWGVGSTGGDFYIMNTTTDTSTGAGMAYPMYNDGSYWVLQNPTICTSHISVPAGYGVYLNGQGGSVYIATAASNSSYGGIRIGGVTTGYGGIKCDHSGVQMMFDSDGNGGFHRETGGTGWMAFYYRPWNCWGIGASTTSSSYRLYVTGSAYATGSWATSDERKKRDIKTIPYALERVCAMRGTEYRWREDAEVGQDPEQWHIGVVAQEIQAVVPEAVHYAADADVYAVDYNGLVGLLIQAVKELREEVNELKTERRR